MQDGRMTDRDEVSQNARALVTHDVADHAVLDIRSPADPDMVDVAAHDSVEPDTGILADLHVADDPGAFGDKNARAQLRTLSVVFV
jgi:hypothetical protein